MSRPILKRRKLSEQIQQERKVAFDVAGWEMVERINCTHWTVRHKACGKVKKYAIASLINTGLKPRCHHCLDKARRLALMSVGYELGARVDSAKFNITHIACGHSFSYRVSNVKSLGMTPKCVFCDAFNK